MFHARAMINRAEFMNAPNLYFFVYMDDVRRTKCEKYRKKIKEYNKKIIGCYNSFVWYYDIVGSHFAMLPRDIMNIIKRMTPIIVVIVKRNSRRYDKWMCPICKSKNTFFGTNAYCYGCQNCFSLAGPNIHEYRKYVLYRLYFIVKANNVIVNNHYFSAKLLAPDDNNEIIYIGKHINEKNVNYRYINQL